jgi:hypothetical protein
VVTLSYSEKVFRQKSHDIAVPTELGPLLMRLSVELQGMAQQTSSAELLVSQLICGSAAIRPEMMKSIQGLDLLRQMQEDAAVLLSQIATQLPASLPLGEGQLEAGLKLDAFARRVVRGIEMADDNASNTADLFDS